MDDPPEQSDQHSHLLAESTDREAVGFCQTSCHTHGMNVARCMSRTKNKEAYPHTVSVWLNVFLQIMIFKLLFNLWENYLNQKKEHQIKFIKDSKTAIGFQGKMIPQSLLRCSEGNNHTIPICLLRQHLWWFPGSPVPPWDCSKLLRHWNQKELGEHLFTDLLCD